MGDRDWNRTIRFTEDNTITPNIEDDDKNVRDLLKKIADSYGALSAFKLIDITHREDTAWYKTYYDENEDPNKDEYKFNLVIPKRFIKEYYTNIK